MKVFHEIKPIYNKNSKILILGSMPGPVSRKENFFYANKSNRFWKIMENLFNIKLLTNEERTLFLLNNNIALWDVIYSCDVVGSSDASIKNVTPNDIDGLIKKTNIEYIFVTGKTSEYYYNKYVLSKTNIKPIYLPSPSAANATYSLDKLINEYSIILKYI